MCNPGESTGRLISIVDAVLVNTSSTTGLEAVAVGKPVLALGSCHYNVTGVVDEINKLINVDSWPDVIRTQELSQLEKEQVIHKYLSNTIEDATWALAGIGKTTYHEQICRTLDKCIDMANSGYVPMYHGN